MLVVPGGGPFADAVRQLDSTVGLGDRLAHRLALAAMDQLGLLLSELLPDATPVSSLAPPTGEPRLTLLRCAAALADRPDVPERWEVTSDSLAVLAAGVIGTRDAILLKAVPGLLASWPASADQSPLAQITAPRLAELQRLGEGRAVDPYLAAAIARTGVTVTIRAAGGAAGAPEPGSRRTDRRRRAQLGDRCGDQFGRQHAAAVTAAAAADRTPTMSAATRVSSPGRSWPATPKLPPAARVAAASSSS